jgi:hypothetical protein
MGHFGALLLPTPSTVGMILHTRRHSQLAQIDQRLKYCKLAEK